MHARSFASRVLALVFLAAFTVACGGGGGAASDSGTLIVSIGVVEPKHLIPSSATEVGGSQVLDAIFSPLVVWDDKFAPHEYAAESITSTDNKTWTIKLKPGWTFHNGEPVTADSYINAWNAGAWGPNAHDGNYHFEKIAGYAAMNPRDGKSQPTAKKLTGLVKKDDLTFDVTLNAPYVNFKSMMGYTVYYPLPAVAFEDVANNKIAAAFEQAPIGNGPFKVKGVWQHDQSIETERFTNYKGPEQPKVAGILFKIYQQLTTQYQDLLAGQLDVVPEIAIESMGNVESDLGGRYGQSPSSTIQFMAVPTFDKRYSNVAIRRAISMAIDRDEISKTIFLNSQRPLRSFVSPTVPGYRENSCGEWCQYNPAKAKQMFDAAGGAKAVGGRIELAYNVDGGHKSWIDATCNQLRKNLGVECVPNPQPRFAELLRKVETKQPVGLFRMGWVADYPVIENYLGPVYATYGSSNYYGYSNKEFDKLVADGDQAPTPEESLKFYQRAEDLLARDMPVIPLRIRPNNFGFSTRVKNVIVDPFFKVDVRAIEANATR
jgi:oligopeptide transport system substrate-binding protein